MTKLQIINAALTRIGVDAINNINDPSKASRIALLQYEMAEDIVLRSHRWPCAMIQALLVRMEDTAWLPLTAYSVGQIMTSNRIIYLCKTAGVSGDTAGPAVFLPLITDGTVVWEAFDYWPTKNVAYEFEYLYPSDCVKLISVMEDPYSLMGKVIYTSKENAQALYIRKILNPEAYDAMLTAAIIAKLAELMAPGFDQKPIVVQLIQEYQLILQEAQGQASGEGKEDAPAGSWWVDA